MVKAPALAEKAARRRVDEPEAAACGKRAASKTAPSAAGEMEGDEGSRNIPTPGTQDGKRPTTRSTSARYE